MRSQLTEIRTRPQVQAFAFVALMVACGGTLSGGDLSLRFQYAGELPVPEAIQVDKDAEFCGQHPLVDESLLVNSQDRGIKNVVVYLYTGRGGSEVAQVPSLKRTHTLTSKHCRFDPHILVMQAGDTLNLTNSDSVGHNANVSIFRNSPAGQLIPVYGARRMKLDLPEPAPLPVQCNIHPWMNAYVVVLEHRYVGVSDVHGKLVIRDLPEKELTFRVFVEAAKGVLGSVTVNGKQQDWPRNRFRYSIQAGKNDMGTVTLTADHFRRP
ncbi:methylamine utilization protein [Novipirellula sp. SH528]|uniref:methylamine utilization protein n=1 Tax=Novipirellula sp. SH528 TaxID=3454466 RepID=UPI003FA0668B